MSDETSGSNSFRARFLLVAGCCRLAAIAAAESRKIWDVLDRVFFIELRQIRLYDVSYQLDIGHNISSADSTLTNRRGNALFCFRKQISDSCDVAMYTSVSY